MATKFRLSKAEWAEQSHAKVEAAQAELSTAVGAIVTGDDWRRYLEFQAKMHAYSPNNIMLLVAQHEDRYQAGITPNPSPGFIAGFNSWKSLGRMVRKGEKGYAVLAPISASRRTAVGEDGGSRTLARGEHAGPGETEQRSGGIRGFKVEHVFESSQTDGEPLPEVPHPKLLAGEAPEGLGLAVMALIEAHGFSVDTVPDAASIQGANGQTNWGAKSVVVRADMDDAAMVKTLIHEAAHVMLHLEGVGSGLPRPLKEVEAESVAFVVASAHGMPTDDYSFPYVAGWAGGENPAKAVHATQARVGQAARLIIEASPAPHEAGGKAPGGAAAVQAARQAKLDCTPVIEPVDVGVGV
jgi:antirestriction protein ArdC